MELPSDFWTAAGVVVAVILGVGGGIKWWLYRGAEKERDRIARESHELTKKTLDTETIPQVSVEVHNAADFPGFGVLREGVNHALRPPSPWVAPTALLVVTVKNEGKISVTIDQAGVQLERTRAAIRFHQEDVDPAHGGESFPYPLPPRESFEIRIQPVLIRRMLGVLQAQPGDEFTLWVSERIGKRYFSPPLQASDFLEDKAPVEVAVSFEPPALTVEVGEEEHFPEGLQLPNGSDELPTGRASPPAPR